MAVDINVLAAAVGCAAALATFFVGRFSAARSSGKDDGVLLTDMGYIKSGVDDIRREQREQAKTNIEVLTRLVAVEAAARQAHQRLDTLEERKEGMD